MSRVKISKRIHPKRCKCKKCKKRRLQEQNDTNKVFKYLLVFLCCVVLIPLCL